MQNNAIHIPSADTASVKTLTKTDLSLAPIFRMVTAALPDTSVALTSLTSRVTVKPREGSEGGGGREGRRERGREGGREGGRGEGERGEGGRGGGREGGGRERGREGVG